MNIQSLPHKAAYVAGWRNVIEAAKNAPETLMRFDWYTVEPAFKMRRLFQSALMRRINERGGDFQANEEIPAGLIRDARRLKEIRQRVRHYQFESKIVRERFGHLLASREDC